MKYHILCVTGHKFIEKHESLCPPAVYTTERGKNCIHNDYRAWLLYKISFQYFTPDKKEVTILLPKVIPTKVMEKYSSILKIG